MEIECEFRHEEDWYGVPSSPYVCKVYVASITAPGTTISKFKGSHDFRSLQNRDVKKIFFMPFVSPFDFHVSSESSRSRIQIRYFPRGLNSHFGFLRHLTIMDCGLAFISRMDLTGLEDLETIKLGNNKLTTLPSDLFVGFRKLKQIDFNSNKLEFVSSKLFTPNLQYTLEYADFRNNTKIDASFDERDFFGRPPMGRTLKQLMDMIDEKCEMPEGEPEIDVGCDGDFHESLADMWDSKVFSDFTIITKDSKEFPVHKNILGLQSSVFATAFSTDMQEKRSGRMTIYDFSAKAVEQFLKFFYTGRIADGLHAMELFALAAKYDVPKLKMKCEQVVLRKLNETNAMEVFTLAHLYSAPKMKGEAFNMIKKSMPDKTLNDCLKDDIETLSATVTEAREQSRKNQEATDEVDALKKVLDK